MKEIAIITIYDDVNIGNKLQNYALEQTLASRGFRVASVICKETQYSPRYLPMKLRLKRLLIPRLRRQHKLFARRIERFRRFSADHLSLGETVSFRDTAQNTLRHYDYFVVGSDQVWHNWRNKKAELDYFFLRFAPRQKRICYAPSFGFDQVPEGDRETYREGLNGFPALSCRERSGCELIRRLTGRDARLVCDPTLLLSASDWDRIAKKPEYEVPEAFMLVYFLGGKSEQTTREIERIASEKGLSVIDVYSSEVQAHYMTAPDEFLYLMRHAAYVCTDSFHGSVFSVLYRRPFHVFGRKDSGGAKMGNRIATLLDRLGIPMETVPGAAPQEYWNENFERAESRIEQLRAEAEAYLRQVLPE